MSARTDLASALKPLLPPKWRLVDTERNLDVVDRFTVMIRQRQIKPAPNMLGSSLTTLVITVISPFVVNEKYEDDLDDAVAVLLEKFRTKLPNLMWQSATKQIFMGTNPAYDIAVTVVTTIT